jgi:hypothetical protein
VRRVGPDCPRIRNAEGKLFGVGNVQITSFNTEEIVNLRTLYGAIQNYYYYYYYYYYTIWMSLVTGLFFPVLLLNQQ